MHYLLQVKPTGYGLSCVMLAYSHIWPLCDHSICPTTSHWIIMHICIYSDYNLCILHLWVCDEYGDVFPLTLIPWNISKHSLSSYTFQHQSWITGNHEADSPIRIIYPLPALVISAAWRPQPKFLVKGAVFAAFLCSKFLYTNSFYSLNEYYDNNNNTKF